MVDFTLCPVQTFPMPAHDAAQRVRLRLKEWIAREGHGSKKRLAEAVAAKYGDSKSQSWVTSIQRTPDNDGQDIRLKDLDDVAACMGLPPGELVSSYDRKYLELTMVEAKLVEYYRLLPDTVRAHWIYWLDYLFKPHRHASEDTKDGAKKKPAKTPKQKPPGRAAS